MLDHRQLFNSPGTVSPSAGAMPVRKQGGKISYSAVLLTRAQKTRRLLLASCCIDPSLTNVRVAYYCALKALPWRVHSGESRPARRKGQLGIELAAEAFGREVNAAAGGDPESIRPRSCLFRTANYAASQSESLLCCSLLISPGKSFVFYSIYFFIFFIFFRN